jgi:putative intracellular protease/amidase
MKKLLSIVVVALVAAGCLAPEGAETNDDVELHTESARGKRVLVIVSAATVLPLAPSNGRPRSVPTGYFLNELGGALRKFDQAGVIVEVATPGAAIPTIDANNFEPYMYKVIAPLRWRERRDEDLAVATKYFGRLRFSSNEVGDDARRFVEQAKVAQRGLAETPMRSLEAIANDPRALARYDAIYVPGGHAPKVDLLYSAAFAKILRAFHAAGKPTALICHAPVTLLSTLPGWRHDVTPNAAARARFPYAGYRVAVGNVAEEKILENFLYLKGENLEFYVAPQLEEVSMKVNPGFASIPRVPSTTEVVVDRELLTGGNPASTDRLATELVKALARR